jgi:hypothetical protein
MPRRLAERPEILPHFCGRNPIHCPTLRNTAVSISAVIGDWESMLRRENFMATEDAKADLVHSPVTGIGT